MKTRFNDKQSDAEIVQWESDDDDEMEIKHKTISKSANFFFTSLSTEVWLKV